MWWNWEIDRGEIPSCYGALEVKWRSNDRERQERVNSITNRYQWRWISGLSKIQTLTPVRSCICSGFFNFPPINWYGSDTSDSVPSLWDSTPTSCRSQEIVGSWRPFRFICWACLLGLGFRKSPDQRPYPFSWQPPPFVSLITLLT